ncbi:hypothetical protein OG216_19520 [Streptomycetaceae bacterium NBC_01309]
MSFARSVHERTLLVPASERVVVIPCSVAKATEPAPAGELYVGSYHRACRATADALIADGGTILILSARHGLMPVGQVVAPYAMTWGDRGEVRDSTLQVQARKLGVAWARDVIVLAGAAYVTAARQVWPYATAPLAGLGIGRQRRRLVELRAEVEQTVTGRCGMCGRGPTVSVPDSRGPEWRDALCDECGWEIEINRWGDRTVCACNVAE